MGTLAPGTLVDEVPFRIEPGKIHEFARATGATDPVHTDADAARSVGATDLLATLTQSVAIGHYRDQRAFTAALGLAMERIVVGSVSWEYRRPLVARDEFTATRRVESDTSRAGRSGPMRFVTLATEFADADGDVALVVREVLIERGTAS